VKPAVFHPDAVREYLEVIEYHAAIRVELGERFDSEIQRLVGEVCCDPERLYRFHPPAQRALSSAFPYSVVYLEEPDRIWIVAVMHAKRRPGCWRKRL
jgi:toxin ParE1/3/4